MNGLTPSHSTGLDFVRHCANPSGCPEFPDNQLFVQFTFGKDVTDMPGNHLLTLAKQLRHVFLGQPYGFIFQPGIDFDLAVGGLV
jgi:hypothetical protein